MRVIDFHTHFYPPSYLDALRSEDGPITVTDDRDGNPVLQSPGDVNIAVRGHRDIAYRETVLDQEGVDMQVLTLTAPGVLLHPREQGIVLARLVNDTLATITRARPNRFTALATLPLSDPDASVDELDRAMGELGLRGVMLFSNVNGLELWAERYEALYRRADELEAVFYIHPTYPVGVEAMTEYWLMPLVGFAFDTTLAAAGLVFSGVVERFPNITWILAHLGGAIPFLAERLDRGYHAYARCRTHIDRPPSEYLRRFYYDTVNFDRRALQLGIDFAGDSHLLAGSDYPHQIGSIRSMVESIETLAVAKEAKSGILGGNAARLLRL